MARLFPRLAANASSLQLAQLLAATELVGMECPGLHSIFLELSLEFTTPPSGPTAPASFRYQVTRFEPRFSMVMAEVTSVGVHGQVRALLRPPPVSQPSLEALRPLVAIQEFASQDAFVVGGSRGLGEVAAKLLAAGGANVTITYHLGQDDALRVAAEIAAAGLRAATLKWNVLRPGRLDEATLMRRPTHIYYFATPRIVAGPRQGFSSPLFLEYCRVYLGGLHDTLAEFAGPALAGLQGLYCPSSVYVDEVPAGFGEYAAAKAAAETLCNALRKSHSKLRVHAPRLPRLLTDQTAAVASSGLTESGPLLLSHFRELAGRS